MSFDFRQSLLRGLVIPACPLALDAERRLDERRQRALIRYYAAAGAGGLAVGVHTTQFAIHDPRAGLFKPLLQLASEELDHAKGSNHTIDTSDTAVPSSPGSGLAAQGASDPDPLVKIAGVCGLRRQMLAEAALVRETGYHACLISLAAFPGANDDALIDHCRAVAGEIPVIGFYLQPAAGGRPLSYSFWRRFMEIENVAAIKIAPFNRYQTIEVVRAVAESGREDVALYTGNDDNIVLDLLTPFRFRVDGETVERRLVGGLLGHWAVWTRRAVELHAACRRLALSGGAIPPTLLRRNIEVTDANAALFDAANGFAGCIPGLHEILRRQGLLEGLWCLDPNETPGPGQIEEINRVTRAYPHLTDDDFVARHRDEWLRG